MQTLIAYVGVDEVLVTTPEDEHQLLIDYFDAGGRNKDDYDREVRKGAVEICVSCRIA